MLRTELPQASREVMPTAPIYSNVYFDLCVPTLYEFSANVRFGLSYALLYTTLVKPPEASSLDASGLVGSDLEVVVDK